MRDVGISTPVGDDKVRINAASFIDPVVIRANESFQALAIGKRACTCDASHEHKH
jgi:hypothetical protein